MNALVQVQTRPDLFALEIMKKEGYMSFYTGEGVYLFPCKKMTCLVQTEKLCYDEIPVVCGEEKVFLKPLVESSQESELLLNVADCFPTSMTSTEYGEDWGVIPSR